MKSLIEPELTDIVAHPTDALVLRRDPISDPSWDAKLAAFPTATIFHARAWAKVLRDTYGFKPYYLELQRAGRAEALLPVMDVESWITGRRGVSLPFADECPPLSTEPGELDRLYDEAISYGRTRKWKYFETRGADPSKQRANPSLVFVGHRLALNRDEQLIFNEFESSTKRAVRKAENSGLTIEISQELSALEVFYRLFCGTRKRLGVPPQPFRFFANIHRHILLENQGSVIIAWKGKTPVAGAVYFSFLKSVIYKFGASDAKFLQFRGNNLVMWEAIKQYRRKGFEVLEFGRTSSTNEGLLKFKQNWGSTSYKIPYFRQNLRTGNYESVRDSAEGSTHFLSLLPSSIFKLVGTVFYRHMT